jgi:hypothetical protein
MGRTQSKPMENNSSPHYFESHITIAPVFGKDLEVFRGWCRMYKFHVAELLMVKSRGGRGVPSRKDAFCTSRGTSLSDLQRRTTTLVKMLDQYGFTVRRAKIEYTLFDSRHEDCFGLAPEDVKKTNGRRKSETGR